MSVWKLLAAVALGTIMAAPPVIAGTKTLKLDTGDFLSSPASLTDGGFLTIPDGGGLGGILFYMPKDHQKDKPAIFRLMMQISETGCNLEILAVGSARLRVGKVQGGGGGPAGRFDAVTPGVTVAPGTSGKVFIKDFKLRPMTSGPVIGLRKGDLVGALFGRSSAVTDTCANSLSVIGAQVIYPTP